MMFRIPAIRSIPDDVREKILRFVKAGLAVSYMKGKSYLSMGSVSMGIAGSIVREDFFQEYLGMRNEYIDMSEFNRRLDQEIYDKDEFVKALEWTKKYCREGKDLNTVAAFKEAEKQGVGRGRKNDPYCQGPDGRKSKACQKRVRRGSSRS